MSLVGTRPPTVDEYEQYELGHRKRLPKEDVPEFLQEKIRASIGGNAVWGSHNTYPARKHSALES